MSGRIAAVAGRQEKDGKVTLLVGSASGGVWKSEDGGTTFKPVFDKQPVQVDRRSRARSDQPAGNVGRDPAKAGPAIPCPSAMASTNRPTAARPGPTSACPEPSGSRSIVVHPKNGNIVYVCAPGALWSDSPDRGLYKTTDGGKTWSLILKGANLSTGCSSVALDPANPEHLLAGTWDFRRKPYEFRSGGNGPDAALGQPLRREP